MSAWDEEPGLHRSRNYPINRTVGELAMIRLIFATVIAMASIAALAQQPNPKKFEACQQLARERGFKFGVFNKGAVKPKDFVRGCMRGTQK